MSEPTDDFEYERRFFCRELPAEYDDGDAPTLIIQSYYVHADNYALRLPLVSRKLHVPSLIHISQPTRRTPISYAFFCLNNKYEIYE